MEKFGNVEGTAERPIAGIDESAPDKVTPGNDPDIPGKVIPDMLSGMVKAGNCPIPAGIHKFY